MNRWRIFVTLLLLLGLLGACTRAPQLVTQTPSEAAALFGDHDIDAATLVTPTRLITLDGTELDELADLSETDEFTVPTSEVDPSAVLPNTYGTVAFIRNNPNLSANPWMVYLVDQATDTTTTVYGGRREIDSVAVTEDGNTLLVAMRRTSDPTADFEVYRITISTSTVERLTTTAYHESNVSMSADGSVLVWEGEDGAGRRAVFIREGATQTHLALSLEQKDPSVSSNGQFIALIRTLVSGNPRIMRYDRNANSYQVVYGQNAPIALSHPSSSDDGSRIAFLEYRPSPVERQIVRYLDTTANTVANVFGAQLTDGPRIGHPHLAGDGDHLTYAWRQGERWSIFTRRISSGEVQRIAASPVPTTNRAPFWQVAPPLVPLVVFPVTSTCGADIAVGETCEVVVAAAGPEAVGWRGAEFDIANSAFDLVVGSVQLAAEIASAGCLAANGPVRVAVACSGEFVAGGPLVTVAFARVEVGPSSFTVSEAALVNVSLEIVDAVGGTLEVE
jgi:hypothetical protein